MDNQLDNESHDEVNRAPDRPEWVAEAVSETPKKEDETAVLLHRPSLARRIGEEFIAWVKTFASAAVYASLIVTFGFQVARVEGKSMEPTLQDQDRLITGDKYQKNMSLGKCSYGGGHSPMQLYSDAM